MWRLCDKTKQNYEIMKTTNALMAAALAGVFAAGTTVSHAVTLKGSAVSADADKEKDKCSGKDGCKGKDSCKGKEKKEKEEKMTLSAVTEADKDKCSGKDGCKGKDKKKEDKGEIL